MNLSSEDFQMMSLSSSPKTCHLLKCILTRKSDMLAETSLIEICGNLALQHSAFNHNVQLVPCGPLVRLELLNIFQ